MKIITIIIPTLNESGTIESCLKKLSTMRKHGHEVIVVDGGSIDGTAYVALFTAPYGMVHCLETIPI